MQLKSQASSSPSSSNTLERGRKIHEEKKKATGVFPVYNLTRSPLTAAQICEC